MTTSNQFQRAERKQSKLRLAITGPSGSGKTYSALLVAKGLGGKIAMADTEKGSGSLYAHLCSYDVLELDAPYSPQRYIEVIHAAEAAGYDVLILDCISHEWYGVGGCLEMHDAAVAGQGTKNSFTAWQKPTSEHNRFIQAMLQSRCHIIATMRSKQDYAQVTGDDGKKRVDKLGMAPIQREGMDYEFTTVLDVNLSHMASASKDRTGLFDGQFFKPAEETGRMLMEWLMSGKAPEETVTAANFQAKLAELGITSSPQMCSELGVADWKAYTKTLKAQSPTADPYQSAIDDLRKARESRAAVQGTLPGTEAQK